MDTMVDAVTHPTEENELHPIQTVKSVLAHLGAMFQCVHSLQSRKRQTAEVCVERGQGLGQGATQQNVDCESLTPTKSGFTVPNRNSRGHATKR